MAFCDIKNPPEFSTEVRKWDRETLADGQEMAIEIEQIFNNTFYNKTEIERIKHVTEVTLTAAEWAGTAAPYTQTITVPGVTADTEAMVVSALAENATEALQKAYSKAFGIVTGGTASLGDGIAVFRVYKKPTTDITIGLKGV